jgi:hypothetical protein
VLAGLTEHLLAACRESRSRKGSVRGRGRVEKVNCENLRDCQPKEPVEMDFAQGEAAEGCE